MQTWQLQNAKAHLSEVVKNCALHGPCVITVRGKEEVVLIAKKDYDNLIGQKPNLVAFMQKSPLKGVNVTFERSRSKIREIDL